MIGFKYQKKKIRNFFKLKSAIHHRISATFKVEKTKFYIKFFRKIETILTGNKLST